MAAEQLLELDLLPGDVPHHLMTATSCDGSQRVVDPVIAADGGDDEGDNGGAGLGEPAASLPETRQTVCPMRRDRVGQRRQRRSAPETIGVNLGLPCP